MKEIFNCFAKKKPVDSVIYFGSFEEFCDFLNPVVKIIQFDFGLPYQEAGTVENDEYVSVLVLRVLASFSVPMYSPDKRVHEFIGRALAYQDERKYMSYLSNVRNGFVGGIYNE